MTAKLQIDLATAKLRADLTSQLEATLAQPLGLVRNALASKTVSSEAQLADVISRLQSHKQDFERATAASAQHVESTRVNAAQHRSVRPATAWIESLAVSC